MKKCFECAQGFKFTEADRQVLAKFSAPEPNHCPDCRMRQVLAFRNEINFHKAKCAITGKGILTNIPPNPEVKVMASEAWHSDQWDPLAYGRDFDFSRPFFEQVESLIKSVPHINLMNDGKSENSDYCNHISNTKDSYYSVRVANSEQAYYSYLAVGSYRVFDCYNVSKSERCYQALDSSECFDVTFSQRLKTCRNVHFSIDCIGCEDCFGCVGLRQKKYHFFNQPLSKEDYERAVAQFNVGSYAFIKKINERFYQEEALKHFQRFGFIENSENAVGNYIYDSRNIDQGFDCSGSEDVRYGWGIVSGKDNYHTYATYLGEEIYNSVSCLDSRQIKYSYAVYGGCYDLEYCFECIGNVKNCFASTGLKRKQYCILNKQYSESDYHILRAKIIEHMKKTGEYGQFFPIKLSPFAYNETVAQEYFPLSKAEADAKGYFWFEEKREPIKNPYQIPDHIKDVNDDILDAVLTCEKTGRPYKIIPQELKFYREMKIPIPRVCPYERHLARIHQRLPRKLWSRECQKCQALIQTAYSPERPEKLVCERCYLKIAY